MCLCVFLGLFLQLKTLFVDQAGEKEIKALCINEQADELPV